MTCFSPVQIGIRYLSPVFPVLILTAAWGALAVGKRWWRGLGIALTMSVVLLSLSIAPHQLAWFNPILGGPAGAWHWYIDSNQDWGQSRDDLRDWIARENIPCSFAPVEGSTTGWVAIATNVLVGLDPKQHERYRWLRDNFRQCRFVMPYWHIYKIPEDYWTCTREPKTPRP